MGLITGTAIESSDSEDFVMISDDESYIVVILFLTFSLGQENRRNRCNI